MAAIFDGIGSISKHSSGKLSSEAERVIYILGATAVVILLFLGIYWVTSSEEYSIQWFFGTVLLFFSIPFIVIAVVLLIGHLRD